MKKIVQIVFLVLTIALLRGFAGDTYDTGDDTGINSKSKELVAGKNTRLEKISAVYSFVRDEISQIDNQYG
ncbi:MAG: hypothetical protein PHR77_00080 [Kiritimatiellae bacterium]|nr:hypothetical protein [Kiritimatiellia bacterium]MDD5519231.1 hypothetical protein [Kiritimatiellia bacterium]